MRESEYGGGGVLPNGVIPQEEGVIPNSTDQLLLLSSTGQTRNTHTPVDPYYWRGGVAPEPVEPLEPTEFVTQSERYSQY